MLNFLELAKKENKLIQLRMNLNTAKSELAHVKRVKKELPNGNYSDLISFRETQISSIERDIKDLNIQTNA